MDGYTCASIVSCAVKESTSAMVITTIAVIRSCGCHHSVIATPAVTQSGSGALGYRALVTLPRGRNQRFLACGGPLRCLTAAHSWLLLLHVTTTTHRPTSPLRTRSNHLYSPTHQCKLSCKCNHDNHRSTTRHYVKENAHNNRHPQ